MVMYNLACCCCCWIHSCFRFIVGALLVFHAAIEDIDQGEEITGTRQTPPLCLMVALSGIKYSISGTNESYDDWSGGQWLTAQVTLTLIVAHAN